MSWTALSDQVEVTTSRARYHAQRLVIAAGPWANEALRNLFPLRVTRQVMTWIQPAGGIEPFLPSRFPVFLCESPNGGPAGYGFPAVDGLSGGVKAAVHGSDVECTPDTIDRVIHEVDGGEVIRKLRPRFPVSRRPNPKSANVHVHHDPRRAFHHRASSAVPRSEHCMRVLRPRVQVCAGSR